MIRPVPLDFVKDRAENDDDAQHGGAVVHCRSGGRRFSRPEAEEDDDEHVGNAADIHSNTEPSRNPPWTPGELDVITALALAEDVVRCGDAAGAAAPEKEDQADEVGEVQSADGERYDVIEGGGRADVYEAEEAGDGSGEGHRGNRDGGTRVYLYDFARSAEFSCGR